MNGVWAMSPAVVPPPPGPTDFGYDAWSFDPIMATANQALTSQQVLAVRVPVLRSFTCTTVSYPLAVVGASLTYARIAIFDAAGTTQLALSADLASTWQSGLVAKNTSIGPVSLPGGPGQSVLVAFLSDGGTPPTFLRQVAGSGPYATMVNNNANRAGTQNAQASMPASLSLTSGAGLLWVGLT